MARMNLYLDVDGVILGEGGRPAQHLDEFLDFVLPRFNCFWLTTHQTGVFDYLRQHLDPATMQRVQGIQPTTFCTLKAEVLAGDFYWLDDAPLACEIEWLQQRGLLDRWIEVNTRRRPDDLLRAVEFLLTNGTDRHDG